MTPYYAEGGIVIYHSDSARVLPTLEPVDLLLTDPPYGLGVDVAMAKSGGTKYGKAATAKRHYESTGWDNFPPPRWLIEWARSIAKQQIIFGGNYFDLPPARCWLVWDKDTTGEFADCELAWTNLDKVVMRLAYRWNGMLQEPGCTRESRVHPTQKPEAVMRWALSLVPDARSVLDPFMGSGTTLVACKRLGRACIGIEREEKYCEIAAKRLQQGALALALEPPEPQPIRMWDEDTV